MTAATERVGLALRAQRSAVLALPHPAAAAAAAVIVLGLLLRALTLTGKAFVFDEAFSVLLASFPADRMLELVAANDPHPPLYYLLLHLWMGIFGDGEGAVRALAVLIGGAAVLVVWLFGRRLIGDAGAVVAAALVAVAPSQVAAGQEARMYGLLTLTALLSWWALHAAVQSGRREGWVVYAAATAAMLYTHYFGLAVWAAQAVYLLVARPPAGARRAWLLAGGAVLLLFSPWLSAFIGQVVSGRAWPAYRPPLGGRGIADLLWGMTAGGPIAAAQGLGGWTLAPARAAAAPLLAIAGAVVLALAALRSPRVSGESKALLLSGAFLPVLLALAVSQRVNVFSPRYLGFIMPMIALVLAAGAGTLLGRTPRRTAAAAVLGAAVLAANSLGLVAYYRLERLDDFDWRAVASVLAAQAREDDAIVYLPGFAGVPVNFYFRGPQPRLALSPAGRDVVAAGSIRMAGVVALLAGQPRVWIVTAAPVPAAVGVLVDALGQRAFRVTRGLTLNRARFLLLERVPVR